jgi:two-component system, chemotaxis family, chemotaxis protein CheY
MRSLVVDDGLVGRKVLCHYLAEYGPCDSAEDGVEGVAAAEKAIQEGHPYDLICLDNMMPNMDGQEALVQIRELERRVGMEGDARSVIFMISAEKDEVPAAGTDLDAYLAKPFNPEQLITELRRFNLT